MMNIHNVFSLRKLFIQIPSNEQHMKRALMHFADNIGPDLHVQSDLGIFCLFTYTMYITISSDNDFCKRTMKAQISLD